MTPRAATFLMFVVNGAAVGTWFAALPGIQTDIQATATEIGLVIVAIALGAIISQQITGQLLMRFDSSQVLRVTSFILPLLLPLPLLAPSPLVLAAVMFFFGAALTAMDVSMNQHGVALEESGGISIMSRLHAGWSIGGIIGAVGVGVAAIAGIPAVAEAAAAGVVLWIAVLLAGRHLGTGSLRTEGTSGISLPSRAVLPIAVVILLVTLVEGGLSDWGGIYLRSGVGSSAEVAAFAYAALSVGLTVGRLAGDLAKDRIGSVRLIRYGMFVTAVAIAVMLLVGEAWVALVGLAVAGVGVANALPQLFGAAGRVPPYGPSLSAGFTFLTFALLIGPPIIGVATDTFGVTAALSLLVLVAVVAGLAVSRAPGAETNPDFKTA